jgi:TonB family protein
MSQDYEGIQNGNAKPDVREAITQLGLEYRLMTQFTSFVAVEEMTVTDGGQPRRIDVPVEMPEGVSHEGVFGVNESLSGDLKTVQQALGRRQLNVANVYSRSKVAAKPRRVASGVGYGKGSGIGPGGAPGYGPGGGGNLGGGASGSGGNAPPPPPPPAPTPLPPPKVIPPQLSVGSTVAVSGGVLQGNATKKVQPAYPAIAKAARAKGAVQVQITVNESGDVINARVINGHPMFRDAALRAAKQWRFKPTELSGVPVKATGILSFNFDSGKTTEPNATVPLTPLTGEQFKEQLRAKLHPAVIAVIERLKNQDAKAGAEELKFTRDGKAEIQVWLIDKSAETINQLKKLGFETMLDPQSSKLIIGRLPIEKLAALVELHVVRYIAPQTK